MLENRSNWVAIAVYESKIAGIIDYSTYNRGKLKIGSLGNVFVVDDYRRKGLVAI